MRVYVTARECVTPTGVQLAREELMRNNGKSDALSALFQLQSKFDWEENFDDNALKYSTLAAFYASSEERISQALAHRAIILYAMGLINEAIHDANEAIKVSILSLPFHSLVGNSTAQITSIPYFVVLLKRWLIFSST